MGAAMRRIIQSVICFLPVVVQAATIGIVRDGPGSWYFEEQEESALAVLKDLVGQDYPVNVRDFNGTWEKNSISNALVRAIQDPEVDVIYAAGVLASMVARALPENQRTKPVFGGAIHYTDARDFPISKDRTSTVPQFTFIASPQRVSADLRILQRIQDSQTVHVIMDRLLYESMPDLDEGSKVGEVAPELQLEFVRGEDTASSYLAAIPGDAKAVYVTLLPRLDAAERRVLYAGLQERKIINLAMMGELEIELGAMAGLGTDTRNAIARRIGLNLDHLLRGGRTEDLQVVLAVQDRLTINRGVAKAIGYSPDYDTALEAEIIGGGVLSGGEQLELPVAMELASQRNIETLIASANLDARRAGERVARSNLLPGVSLDGEYGYTEISGAIDPTGPEEIAGGSYGIQLRQILFNDAAWSGYRASLSLTEAEEYAQASSRLDAMQDAGIAYLQLLLNQKLYEIEKENLRLTRNNLEFARLRQIIGASDATEVYRWESNEARDQSNLFRQDGAVRDALAELNRVLGFDQSDIWIPVDIELGEEEFFFLDEVMPDRELTFAKFERFRDYLKVRAVKDSPELYRFDAVLEAQGITLRQLERRRFVPEISGLSSWTVNPRDTNLAERSEQDEWFIGIVASIPLFEGGGVKAEAEQERANLRVLTHQREQARQLIEERVVSLWNGMGSLHPAIRLSNKSLRAAESSYEAVEDKYTQETATILDLLDAQSQLILQKQEAARALYSYLINMVQLQRVIAWYEHEHSLQDRREWAAGLKEYLDASPE